MEIANKKEEKFVEMNLESFGNVNRERVNHIKRCFLPSWMRMIEQSEKKEVQNLLAEKGKISSKWVKLNKNSQP
jgi:hypothetical protein